MLLKVEKQEYLIPQTGKVISWLQGTTELEDKKHLN